MQDIYDDDFLYDKGILNFNQDLSNNIVLIENGFNTNTIDEVKNSNTKIANAILQVFEEED